MIGIKYQNGEVEFNDELSGVENYVSGINVLIERGYLTENYIPYKVSETSDRYIINSKPCHEDGSKIH